MSFIASPFSKQDKKLFKKAIRKNGQASADASYKQQEDEKFFSSSWTKWYEFRRYMEKKTSKRYSFVIRADNMKIHASAEASVVLRVERYTSMEAAKKDGNAWFWMHLTN